MSEKTKYPGENGLVAMFQLIEDKIKYLKNSIIELIDAANCVFYVKLKLGANGFELDDVTYADIIEAYDSGKRIVAKAVVPAEANLGFDGNFEIPMTYVDDDGMFAFSFTTGLMNCEVFLSSSGSISYSIREYQENGSAGSNAPVYFDIYEDGSPVNTDTWYTYEDVLTAVSQNPTNVFFRIWVEDSTIPYFIAPFVGDENGDGETLVFSSAKYFDGGYYAVSICAMQDMYTADVHIDRVEY